MLESSYLVQMWYLKRAKTMTEQRRHGARAGELAQDWSEFGRAFARGISLPWRGGRHRRPAQPGRSSR